MTGQSFNIYDFTTGRWHQTWVDSRGVLLQLDGEFRDGKMVLSGERASAKEGGLVTDRITWGKVAPTRVRQLWEVSEDGGKSWQTRFDGLYVKAK